MLSPMPSLATSPDHISLHKTSHGSAKKKRKVSMSPVDSLACTRNCHSDAVVPGSLELETKSGKAALLAYTVPPKYENILPDLKSKPTPTMANTNLTLKLSKVDGNQVKASNAAKTTNDNTKTEKKTSKRKSQKGVESQKPSLKANHTKSTTSKQKTSPPIKEQRTVNEGNTVHPKASSRPSTKSGSTQKKAEQPPTQNQLTNNDEIKSDSTEMRRNDASTETKKASRSTQEKGTAKQAPNDSQAKSNQPTTKLTAESTAAGSVIGKSLPNAKNDAGRANEATESLPDAKNTVKPESKSTTQCKASAGINTSTSHKKKLNFQDQVLRHMLIACKPFSLKTLAQSLSTTETALNYLMLSLVDKQLVIKKKFVSSKGVSRELYWANQESSSREIISALQKVSDSERKAASEQLQSLQQQHVNLSRELAMCTKEPSNEDLYNQVQHEQEQVAALHQRLAEIRARIQGERLAAAAPVAKGPVAGRNKGLAAAAGKNRSAPPSCPRRLKIRINAMRDVWKQRKEKCMDFCEHLADGLDKKVKDVVKLLDVETDEMAKVTMPPKHVVAESAKSKK
jgi:predicted transcriptional regulator